MEKHVATRSVDSSPETLVCPFAGQPKPASLNSSSTRSESPTATEHSQTPLHSASSHTDYEPPQKCPIFTQEVDPLLIKTSLEDRVAYLTDYLGFTSRDAELISKIAPTVNEVIPTMVDGMYAKMFEFDITKKIFLNRNQVRMLLSRR